MYCQKCGGKLESYASNCAFCGTPVEKYDTEVKYTDAKKTQSEVKHMTAWRWIGLTFLPCIPLIGIIIYIVLMFKWAFGNNPDLTLVLGTIVAVIVLSSGALESYYKGL